MSTSTVTPPATMKAEKEFTATSSGGVDPVPHDESAPPAIPPKSPKRKSWKAGDASEVSMPIPAHIVARTQGRVKRLTAALEEKPNLHIRQYTWTGRTMLEKEKSAEKENPAGKEKSTNSK